MKTHTLLTSIVVKYFGSKKKLADALGVTAGAISQWGENVPKSRYYELMHLMKRRRGKR